MKYIYFMGTNYIKIGRKLNYKAGDRYNKLILTGKAYIGKESRRFVECICDCGVVKFMKYCDILNGHSTSCGCKRKPHGMSPKRTEKGHPLYGTWGNIKNRCYQKSHRCYPDYGGKGLTVCDGWINSFKSFFDWAMANGWKQGLTIDRIKNELGYSPNNCRWGTQAEQQRNKTNNIVITVWGETKCLTDWIKDERCVVAFNTVRQRMDILKWDAEKALTFPNMNKEGSNYKRENSIIIEYKGQNKNLKDWCRNLGVKYTTARSRFLKGWRINEVFKN